MKDFQLVMLHEINLTDSMKYTELTAIRAQKKATKASANARIAMKRASKARQRWERFVEHEKKILLDDY